MDLVGRIGRDEAAARLRGEMIASGMGVKSERVIEPGRLKDALGEALASGEPRLVEVLVKPLG